MFSFSLEKFKVATETFVLFVVQCYLVIAFFDVMQSISVSSDLHALLVHVTNSIINTYTVNAAFRL